MTIAEMHLAFNLALQEIDSNARDDFLSTEIDRYLNTAQLYFIRDRFSGGNEAGFNQTPTRIGDIQPLIKTVPLIPSIAAEGVSLGSQYEWLIAHPNDQMYPISLEVGITKVSHPKITTKDYVPTKGLSESDILRYRVNRQNDPIIRTPGVVFKAGFMHVFCDSLTTLVDGRFTYCRLPDTLVNDTATPANSVSSELPEHTHDDVVNIAARIATGDLQHDMSPRTALETEAV